MPANGEMGRGAGGGPPRGGESRRAPVGRIGWMGWGPLALLPALAFAGRSALPSWGFMWAMAFALYAGFKWLTYRDAMAQGVAASAGTRMAYLLCWPGMSLKEFAGKPASERRAGLAPGWLGALGNTLAGVGVVWLLVPAISAEAWLLQGWVGMVGIVLTLHFGTFHLVALAFQSMGFNARPNMRSPLGARSLGDFWGRRWNTAFAALADRHGFRPLTRLVGPRWALLAVFAASGLIHEAVIPVPAGAGHGLPTAYFLLQALGLATERLPLIRRRPWLGRLFAWLVLAAPLGWLFPPVFVRNVILPTLQAAGATAGFP